MKARAWIFIIGIVVLIAILFLQLAFVEKFT